MVTEKEKEQTNWQEQLAQIVGPDRVAEIPFEAGKLIIKQEPLEIVDWRVTIEWSGATLEKEVYELCEDRGLTHAILHYRVSAFNMAGIRLDEVFSNVNDDGLLHVVDLGELEIEEQNRSKFHGRVDNIMQFVEHVLDY